MCVPLSVPRHLTAPSGDTIVYIVFMTGITDGEPGTVSQGGRPNAGVGTTARAADVRLRDGHGTGRAQRGGICLGARDALSAALLAGAQGAHPGVAGGRSPRRRPAPLLLQTHAGGQGGIGSESADVGRDRSGHETRVGVELCVMRLTNTSTG